MLFDTFPRSKDSETLTLGFITLSLSPESVCYSLFVTKPQLGLETEQLPPVIAGKQRSKEPADKEPAENQGYIIQRFCYVTLCPSLLYYNFKSQIPNRDNLLD